MDGGDAPAQQQEEPKEAGNSDGVAGEVVGEVVDADGVGDVAEARLEDGGKDTQGIVDATAVSVVRPLIAPARITPLPSCIPYCLPTCPTAFHYSNPYRRLSNCNAFLQARLPSSNRHCLPTIPIAPIATACLQSLLLHRPTLFRCACTCILV